MTEVPAAPRIEPAEETPSPYPTYTSEDAKRDARAAGEGIDTGIPGLHEHEFVWKPGKLYAIAARPSEGKTTLMLHTLMRVVQGKEAGTVQRPGPAVFISYEESLRDIYVRLILWQLAETEGPKDAPSRGAVEAWLRRGPEGVSVRAWRDSIADAAANLDRHVNAGRLVIIDGDEEGGNVGQITARIWDAVEAGNDPPAIMVVDYFQKVRPPEHARGDSRQVRLQEVSGALLRFAKGIRFDGVPADPTREVPVIVGAQVNREGADKQPLLEHTREADDLANDSAGVLTLWRPGIQADSESGEIREPEDGAEIRVHIAKNRDGRRGGTVKLSFYGSRNYVLAPDRSYGRPEVID